MVFCNEINSLQKTIIRSYAMKKIARIFLVVVAFCVIVPVANAQQNKAEQLYQQGIYEMEGKGDYAKAIESFNQVMTKFPKEKVTGAKALLNIGRCYEKLGKSEATKAYERILKEFKDQPQIVAEASARLAVLKQSADDGVSQSIATNRQIWAGKDVDTEGTPSPDGQYLSYSHKGWLAIYNVKTGERKDLGNLQWDSERHMCVNESVWSPDGKQLAYGLNDEEHGIAEIHLINRDGSGDRMLCTADKGNFYIFVEDWSRDGKMILAVFLNNSNQESKIAMVSVTDGSVRIIKTLSNWDWKSHKMFFSPDSRFIAYSSPTEKKGKSCDVFVVSVDGSSEVNITQHPDDDGVVCWDPNGNSLLFASNRGGSYNLWTIKILNGQPQEYPKQIRNNIGKISPMGLTKEGSLYYSVTSAEVTNFSSHESNIYLASLDPKTGKIESPAQPLTMQNNGFNHSLTWSPDGKKLLFYSAFWENSSNHWNKTFIFSPETGLEKNVVSQIMADTVTAYNWFPDGKHLAVMARLKDGSSGGIYNFEIKTGKMVPLLISNKDTAYAFPSVSPDGKTIFTHTFVPNNQSIYSYDTEKKERKLLFQSGKDRYIYSVRLSSDGKQLAFILMTTRPDEFAALMVMPSSGGEARAIFRSTTSGLWGLFAWYYGLDWSPDGKYIYFARRNEEGDPFKLLRVPVQGGTPEQTGVEMEGLHSISIRPDGKQIAFSAGADPKQAIWVLENIFAEDRTQLTKLSGLTTRRILEDANKIGDVLTANGKYIRSLDENTGDLIQFEIASGDTTRIKNKSEWGEYDKNNIETLIFSPDGEKIVYNISVFDSVTNRWGYQLRIRNLDGSELRTFYDRKDYYIQPYDWSPDNKFILAVRSYGQNKLDELVSISISDGSLRVVRKISSDYIGFLMAKFSPDGKYIAFSQIREDKTPNLDIFLINSDDTNKTIIADHLAEDQMLRWTPDGKGIIFLSDRSGTWDIWLVHITNGKQQGEPELLKKDFGYNIWNLIGFAPDGSLFYKTHTSSGGLYYGSLDIKTGKIIDQPVQVTTRYIGLPSQPTWSPDGNKLTYISSRGLVGPSSNILTVRSVSTEEEHFLSPRLRYVNQISWAPNSRSIIAIGFTTANETGIFRINDETSEITKLADMGMCPKLCPDGKTLVFAGEKGIMKRDLEIGSESVVVTDGKMFYDLSPDGKEVVYHLNGPSIMIQSLSGGEPREIFRGPERPLWYYGLRWTRDGRYIVVRPRFTESKISEIFLVPVDGGTPIKLEISVTKIESFTLHPDNKRFAFSVIGESKSELWVMENFLPKAELSQQYTKPLTRQIWAGADVDNLGAPSPDGHDLSFTDWETGDLAIRNLETGEKRHLTNKGSWEQSDEFALVSIFSPNGKMLAYNWYNKDNFFDLRLIASDGSGGGVLFRDDKYRYFWPLDWTQDGKQILIISQDYNYNCQMILVSSEDGSQQILKQLGYQCPTKAFFSEDGKYVVYDFPQREDSPERDIIMLRTDGSKGIQIVKHPADDYLVGSTSDGRKIIFVSDRTGAYDLWSIQMTEDSNGRIPELVKKDAGSIWPMGLTKKGSLYYSLNTGTEDVFVASLDFTKGVLLSQPEKLIRRYASGNFSPTFSPDGNYVAYVSEVGKRLAEPGKRVLCIRSLKTGEEHEIVPKLSAINKLKWSPDGRYILLTGQSEKNKSGTYRLDIQTKEIVLVRETQADETIKDKIWSNDGKAIFYIITELKKNLCRLMMREIETNNENELYRLDVTNGFSRICLSPDGTRLAFTTIDAKTYNPSLKVLSTQGGEAQIILSSDQPVSLIPITWTTDGKKILFVKISRNRQEQTQELYSISADGGEQQKLSFPLALESMNDLCVSPDGQHIAYTTGKRKTEIWVTENFLPKEKK